MRRLLDLVRRRQSLEALPDEIRAHLDEKVDALVASGMSRADALREARRAFGHVGRIEEAGRDVWRIPAFDEAVADLAFGFRFLRRSPTFAAVAVLSLAIGIGANAAVFTVIDALLLRRLPVLDPSALVAFTKRDADTGAPSTLTFHEYDELRSRTSSFAGMLAYSGGAGSLQPGATSVAGANEPIHQGRVSSNFFDVLGVRMAVGRAFTPVNDVEADPERSVVLSYAYWQRRFGGDPSIVGKPVIVFRGMPFTVVGVAARGFTGIEPDHDTDAWWPVANVKLMALQRLTGWNVTVVARLKHGVDGPRARAEATVVHARVAADEAAAHADWTDVRRRRFLAQKFAVVPGGTGIADATRARFTQPLYVLMASVLAVLLIASANVGALLLARTTARRRELALRLALGSGRPRVIRQLVTENILLAAIATAAGLSLVPFALRILLSYAPADVAAGLQTAPDVRTLMFIVAIAFASALIIGVLPAFRSTIALERELTAGGQGVGAPQHRARAYRVLIATQVAMCMSLLVVAGLFVRTLHNLRGLDAGFDRKSLVIATVNNGAVTAPVARQILPALEAIPGVRSGTFYANLGLLGGGTSMSDCIVDGTSPASSGNVSCVMMQVGPHFFETTSTRIVAGRPFAPGDEPPGASVAIINETMAQQYFGAESPIGRRINGLEVVGVARDTKYTSLRDPAQRMIYTPVGRGWVVADVRFALHTDLSVAGIGAAIRRAIADAGVSKKATAIESIAEISDATLVRERLLAEVATSFGVLALLLACIGLYGTMSFAVARRTNEIAVRVALGASRATIIGQLMRESGMTVALGAGVGLIGTVALSRILSRLLFGLGPSDPTTIGAAVMLLMAAAGTAAYLPARRASGTDPITALRSD
jgi:putative ABC transport system permease protein